MTEEITYLQEHFAPVFDMKHISTNYAVDLLAETYNDLALSGTYSMEMLAGMSTLLRYYEERMAFYAEPIDGWQGEE